MIDHQAKIMRSVILADPGGNVLGWGGIFRGGRNVRGGMSYTRSQLVRKSAFYHQSADYDRNFRPHFMVHRILLV